MPRKPVLASVLPFLDWIGELRRPAVLRADLVAGITVALVLIPQSMACAQLAGLPAYYGLYAAFLPPMIAALFGSSRQLATGPTAVQSIMTGAGLMVLGRLDPEHYVENAILLALMVGVLRLGLGLLRLGVLVNFLSQPVLQGYTNAVVLIIITSQLGRLLGVSVPPRAYHFQTLWSTCVAAREGLDGSVPGMAALALVVMAGLRRTAPRVPRVLVGVLVTTLVAILTGYGGDVVGTVPRGLPAFRPVSFRFESALELLPMALAIALVGFMECIAIAKAMALRTRQRIDVNRELTGQGLASVIGSFFQSYVVSGSFTRSAVNLTAGAVTGFASVVTTVVVALVLLFLTPLLYFIPDATLAAVIVYAVIALVKVKPILQASRVHPHEGVAAWTTFAVTLGVAPHVEWGILGGLLLSLVFYLYRTMKPRVAILSRHPDGMLRDAETHGLQTCRHISVVRFDRSLYFANAGYFEDKVLEEAALKPELRCVVVDAEGINDVDATGVRVLEDLSARLREGGIEIFFSRMKQPVRDKLARAGLVRAVGADHFFARTTEALEQIWDRMDDPEHRANCPLRIPVPMRDGGPEETGRDDSV